MTEKVDVGRVADPGTTHDQVQHCTDTARGPYDPREIARSNCEEQVRNPGKSHLPGGGTQAIGAGFPAFRQHRTQGPTESAQRQTQGGPQFAVTQSSSCTQIGP